MNPHASVTDEIMKQPITYRILFNGDASKYPLGVHADDSVVCNCKWDGGHEPTCDLVLAHELLAKSDFCFSCGSYHPREQKCLMPR